MVVVDRNPEVLSGTLSGVMRLRIGSRRSPDEFCASPWMPIPISNREYLIACKQQDSHRQRSQTSCHGDVDRDHEHHNHICELPVVGNQTIHGSEMCRGCNWVSVLASTDLSGPKIVLPRCCFLSNSPRTFSANQRIPFDNSLGFVIHLSVIAMCICIFMFLCIFLVC